MTVAERARAAVRARPALHDALRAGVVNHAALATRLDVDGDPEAVAAALRRYAGTLEAPDRTAGSPRVRMRSGVGLVGPDGDEGDGRDDGDGGDEAGDVEGAADDPPLAVGGTRLRDGGSLTAVHAAGDVDARALGAVLGRLRVEGVDVEAAGVGGESLLVVVARRDGPDALRLVEDALKSS
jgi:hypothetical protein